MKSERYIEFSVDICETEGEKIIAKGRCLRGPICLGDSFTEVYCIPNPHSDVSEHVRERAVLLKITRMTAYKRDMEEIDDGLTAAIELAGSGGDAIEPGVVLGNAERRQREEDQE